MPLKGTLSSENEGRSGNLSIHFDAFPAPKARVPQRLAILRPSGSLPVADTLREHSAQDRGVCIRSIADTRDTLRLSIPRLQDRLSRGFFVY